MKLTVDAKALLRACQLAAGATATRTTVPALECIQLATNTDENLYVSATDLEVGMRFAVPNVVVIDAGDVVIDPNRIIGVLRETDGLVTITADKSSCVLKTDKGRFEFAVQDATTFPGVAGELGDEPAKMDQAALAACLHQVAFAVDKVENTRWAVSGVLFDYSAGVLQLVATDTKRLAWRQIKVEGGKKVSQIVPMKTVAILRRLLSTGEVSVAISDQSAIFAGDGWLVTTKLMAGKFPPYRDIIPKKFDYQVILDRDELARCVRLSRVATDDTSRRVEFNFSDNLLTITSSGHGSGEVTMETSGDNQPNGLAVTFDPDYVLPFLAEDSGGEITLKVNDGLKPVVFTAHDPDYLYLVMPMGG